MTDQQSPILNVIGDKVALGPHRRDLLPLYQRWINDFEVLRGLALPIRPMTLEGEQAWYDHVAKPGDNLVSFLVYERATLRPIGTTALAEIDHAQGTAVFGILIGEKECWGKGYGTETTRLMLDYGFTVLGLHNILLTVYSYNQRAIRAYQRAGFKEIGRRREARRLGGRFYDVVYMDCLGSEFEGSILRSLLPTE